MAAPFQEIINSRLFKFIVGETSDGNPTEFSVHEEAIARLSKPLRSLVKGGLSEAQAGCTTWKDVSKETFELFVQFAYTGDYSIPKTEKRKLKRVERNSLTNQASPSTSNGIRTWNKAELNEALDIKEPEVDKKGKGVAKSIFDRVCEAESVPVESEPVESKPVESEPVESELPPEPSPVVRTTREKYPKAPSPRLFAADFPSLSFPLLAPRNNYDNTCEPAEQFEPGKSYSGVLLAHASLYVLGDYRLIDSLKALALYKLHKTLYAYFDEGKGLEEGIGGLRGLVCRYMATNAVVLSHDNGFMDLLGEGGEFVKDFFKFELQMIH
ncbi:uncharacterized protein PAC_15260 [Phialocephala subalpina]|uniref:BTB domain-containing protein n=1 Tax=Phialocephala subalpina TaxID=576137 RepID=A0A1L7XJX9_9HELO|nr:uncharacterized protein PAC_15260 [Phialocephala subalpina]